LGTLGGASVMTREEKILQQEARRRFKIQEEVRRTKGESIEILEVLRFLFKAVLALVVIFGGGILGGITILVVGWPIGAFLGATVVALWMSRDD